MSLQSFATANVPGLPDGGWHGAVTDYTTAVVGNKSIEWIREKAAAKVPWLAYVSRAHRFTICHYHLSPPKNRLIALAHLLSDPGRAQGGPRALQPGSVVRRPLGPV